MAGGKEGAEAPKVLQAERVRQQLADDILCGRLGPGTKLDEVEQARRLAVSRTPVREAFRHLAALGLVVNRPHKGVRVATLDRRTMVDLYEAAAELEGACARLAAGRMGAEEHGLLEEMRQLGACRSGLHEVVRRGAGNPVLEELAAAVRLRLGPYWRLTTLQGPEWQMRAEESCRRVVAALLARDDAAADRLMRAYLAEACRVAERALDAAETA